MSRNKRKIIFSSQIYIEDPQQLSTSFQENYEYEHLIRLRDLEDEIRLLFVSPLVGSNDEYLENNASASSSPAEFDWMAMMYT